MLNLDLKKLNFRFKKFDIKFVLNKAAREFIKIKSNSDKRGARGLKNALRSHIENLVIDSFIDTEITKGIYKVFEKNKKIGFSVEKSKNGTPKYYHTGGGIGASTILLIYPNEELVITVLTNLTGVNMKEFGNQLESYFMD